MMMSLSAFVVVAAAALVQGQRPSFAGNRPIGYPEIATTEGLEDRFGEVDGTTQRLPVEANGSRELMDRLSKLPVDQQPFWFINWQALEAHRQNPQTYPQRPNPFIEPNLNIANSNSGSHMNPGNLNSNMPTKNSDSVISNSNSANRNSASAKSASVFDLSDGFEDIESNQNNGKDLGSVNSNYKTETDQKKLSLKH